jgi:hypothetical protein
MRLVLCELCGKKYVPDLILSSIEIPSHVRAPLPLAPSATHYFETHHCLSSLFHSPPPLLLSSLPPRPAKHLLLTSLSSHLFQSFTLVHFTCLALYILLTLSLSYISRAWPFTFYMLGPCHHLPLPHAQIGIQGQGQLLEVHVCRSKSEKKKQDTEVNAGRVSELMPFLEFDLHKQILCKLKLRAHNAVWGLKMQLSMNDDVSFHPIPTPPPSLPPFPHDSSQ